MRRFTIAIYTIFFTSSLLAAIPDWSSRIAFIVYSKCTSCHHEGGIAPFPLISYQEVISKKTAIAGAVEAYRL